MTPWDYAGVGEPRQPKEFRMPTVNIPPKLRFALYLLGALTVPLAAYLFEKRIIGKEEVTLIGAYVALVNLLAATKTSDPA